MAQYSKWIWSGDWGAREDETPTQVLFRRKVDIHGDVETADVKISADSRYKLYVNGVFVDRSGFMTRYL